MLSCTSARYLNQLTILCSHNCPYFMTARLLFFLSCEASLRSTYISVSIPASGGDFCPLTNLNSCLAVRGTSQGPLFCFPDLLPISTIQFNTWLSRALSFASLSSLPIKSHSFRIGAATHADLQIQKMGRWKSSVFRRYIRVNSYNLGKR